MRALRSTLTAVAVAAALSMLGSAGTPSASAAGSGTLASSTQQGTRLLYVNNPEPLVPGDLANSGRSIFRYSLNAGSNRAFFEHVNKTGSTINYGVFLYNPGSSTVTVTRTRKSWSAGSFTIGGPALATFLNGSENTTLTLPPGGSGWIYRSDLIGSPAAPNQYFTGAVDFSHNGQVIAQNLAFTGSAANLPGSYTYLGYVTGVREGVPQHRVDKGVSLTPAASLSLNVTVPNATTGPVPVTYTPGGATNCPTTPRTASTWRTNYPHTKDGAAVGGDMITLTTPEGNLIGPCANSPYGGGLPNLGNYGVLYTVNVRVANNSGAPRRMTLTMSRAGGVGNTFVAYRNVGASMFTSGVANGSASLTYLDFTAATGTNTYTGYYALGAPATGNIDQTLRVAG